MKWAWVCVFYSLICSVQAADLETARKLQSEKNYTQASQEYAQLLELAPTAQIRYEYGVALIGSGNYNQARETLSAVVGSADSDDLRLAAQSAYGYSLITEGQYESALSVFQKAVEDPQFAQIEQGTKAKILNNLGVSNLLLERYEVSASWFERAVGLGSALAVEGLKKAQSALSALQAQDPNLPGSYGTVVGSTVDSAALPGLRDKLGALFGEPLQQFKSTEGRYYLTIVSGVSYLRAVEAMQRSRVHVADAFVASVALWQAI